MSNPEQMLKEVHERVRRMETRLMHFAELLGIDPSKKVRVTYDDKTRTAHLSALDASIGNLLNVLREQRVQGKTCVKLCVNGLEIGYLTLNISD